MRKVSCVLVVDQDADVREVIGAQIEAIGHWVIACGSAAEARAILAGRTVRLLVADESLFGQARELADHASSLGVPTLLMSAYEEIKDELRLGWRDFIGKPFRPGELVEQVNRVLAKPNNALSGA